MQKRLRDCRKHHPTGASTTCDRGDCERAFSREISRSVCDRWTKHQTHAYSLANALSKNQLPVLRAEARHKGTEDLQEKSYSQDHAEVSSIEGTARERPEEVTKEDLERANPGYV